MGAEFLGLVFAVGLGGGVGIYTAAIALGIRHGIDWDHIAAITDITSATASVSDPEETWLIGEPGLQITDESHREHHGPHHDHEHRTDLHASHSNVATAVSAPGPAATRAGTLTAVEETQPIGH